VTTLLCVSTPISLRQQRYLVFIPEFNVQLLYLPVLKNVVADFLSCPSPTPELSGGIAALVVTDPVCSAVHCSSWFFAKQAACQLAFSAQLYQSNLEQTFFNLHNIFHPGTRLPAYCFF
jgi:hypothetical protein